MVLTVALLEFVIRFLLMALGVTGPTEAADSPRPVVIRDCSILDVERGVMLPGQTVVLAEGKIQSIGTQRRSGRVAAGRHDDRGQGEVPDPGPDRRPRPPGSNPGRSAISRATRSCRCSWPRE